jgi:hypothetical protein
MRITADGLVGIGTQNPTTKLDVDGTVRAPTLNATTALQVAGVNIDTIYAPKSTPTFTGTLTAPTINASTALQINGTSTSTLYASKPWVQCVINGTNLTFASNSSVGRVTPTVTRTSGQAAGAYDITFTTHPNASSYTHSIQVRTDSGFATGVISNVFGNSCKVRLYNASQVLTDYQFSLIIFA